MAAEGVHVSRVQRHLRVVARIAGHQRYQLLHTALYLRIPVTQNTLIRISMSGKVSQLANRCRSSSQTAHNAFAQRQTQSLWPAIRPRASLQVANLMCRSAKFARGKSEG